MSVAREPRKGQTKFNVSLDQDGGGDGGGGGVTNKSFEIDLDNNVNNSEFKYRSDKMNYAASKRDTLHASAPPRWKFFPSLLLLLWKNTVLRRRHYIVTTLEIILPTLFACLIAYLKTWTPPTPPMEANIITNSTQFFEKDLAKDLRSSTRKCAGACLLAYAPSNEFTDHIMNMVRQSLAKYKPVIKLEIRGFETEETIKKFNALQGLVNKEDESQNVTKKKVVLSSAIIFEQGFEADQFKRTKKRSQLSYKIRIVDKNYHTDRISASVKYPGPDTTNAGKGYQEGGFAALQIFVDKAITAAVVNGSLNYTMSVQGFPYPPYKVELDFSRLYLSLLPTLLVFGFIFIVPSILRNVVAEKESGIKELMKMMSLRGYLHWIGWMVDSLFILIIPVTVVVVVLFVEWNEETGAFLVHSDPTVWWVAMFLYVVAAVACLFFISIFFQRATLAIAVGMVVWIATYFSVFIPLERNYQWLSWHEKMAACLLPNMALHWSVKLMYSFEANGIGIKWSNLGQPLSSLDDFALGHVLFMMVVSTVLFMCLTLYFESILPSKYGIRKPWYFIFKKSFWRPLNTDDRSNGMPMTPMRNNDELPPGFEREPMTLNPRVQIRNLRKVFKSSNKNKKVAVADLTLNMFDSQITILLGCNGAGKTTLISMLTGLFSPTSGTAMVNDYDIRKDMDTIRTQLGYCSQYNILFEKLTVAENLSFFGRLKGQKRSDCNDEIDELLEKLQLKEKKHTLAEHLSGGQKRKLSLGMAIIGGSKILIIDEATAGMDPEARRSIWDLLLEVRESRTMLLTTHFMEEADILGDRVAIMSDGKIHCCGSPLFLKQHYGSGYTLKMSVHTPPKSDCDAIFELVKKYVPACFWKEKIRPGTDNEVCDISIVLPRKDGVNDTSAFPAMFEELSKNKDNLGIIDIGLPLTTLDDVFAKVVEETSTELMESKSKSGDSKKSKLDNVTDFESGEKEYTKLTDFDLVRQHFWGLVMKRFIYTRRTKILFSVQLLLPLLLVIAAVLVFNKTNAPLPPSPALKIDLSPYKNPKTMYATSNETDAIGLLYADLISKSGSQIGAEVQKAQKDLDGSLLDVGVKDEIEYRERYVAAADFSNPKHVRAMFQTIPYHGSPLAINLASNAMLRHVGNEHGDGQDFTLTVTNHPLKSGLNSLLESCTPNPIGAQVLPLIFAMLIPLGLSTFAASFIVFPLEERLCRAKHLQIMTGVSRVVYWMSSFVWDLFVVIILALVMLAFFPILQNDYAFTSFNAAPAFFLIIATYGFAAISFSYLISLFVSTVAGGFAFVTVIHIITGSLYCIVVHALEQSNFFDLADTFRWVGRLFPNFSASMSLIRFVDKVGKNVRCNMVTDEVKNIICNPNITGYDPKLNVFDYQLCCDNCNDFADEGVTCFVPNKFILWVSSGDSDWIPANIELPAIGQELIAMVVMAIIYQIILFVIEYGQSRKSLSFAGNSKNSAFPLEFQDVDVKEEDNRVESLVAAGEIEKDAIIVQNLCKRFGRFAAVSNLSFGVHKGECFGMLGVNGAGKTTLFQMITGNLGPTSGNSYLKNRCSLKQNAREYARSIGYCPQYDGLIGCLTGREMLELFCRLRGIPARHTKREVSTWLDRLGLTNAASVQCQKYSGGMKRRLSAAISMVGRPAVIMLDEPTSGVDPVSRRQFWSLVSAGKDAGQALILTSHSMEECEALCTRLAIMVDGRLRCVGTVQHLKTKLTQGFTIMMKMNQQLTPDERDYKVKPLLDEINESFAPCKLKEQHENVIEYQVLNNIIDWQVVFKILEELKQKYIGILEDFSVSDTTLEEIFLNIAKSKNSKRRAKVPILPNFFRKDRKTGMISNGQADTNGGVSRV